MKRFSIFDVSNHPKLSNSDLSWAAHGVIVSVQALRFDSCPLCQAHPTMSHKGRARPEIYSVIIVLCKPIRNINSRLKSILATKTYPKIHSIGDIWNPRIGELCCRLRRNRIALRDQTRKTSHIPRPSLENKSVVMAREQPRFYSVNHQQETCRWRLAHLFWFREISRTANSMQTSERFPMKRLDSCFMVYLGLSRMMAQIKD